jgi:DNA-binding transcriptional MocR family regulator
MSSLAGGIPSPESLPMDILNELNSSVINKYRSAALQCNATEGFYQLIVALSQDLLKTYIKADPKELRLADFIYGHHNAIFKKIQAFMCICPKYFIQYFVSIIRQELVAWAYLLPSVSIIIP